jgi:hypothetical protein
MIHQHEHTGYSKPVYWPANGAYPKTQPRPAKTANKAIYSPVEQLAAIVKTPYTKAYVRSFDGALMVEVGETYVCEEWATKHGMLSAGSRYIGAPHVVELRKEARAIRKSMERTIKEKGARRAQTIV